MYGGHQLRLNLFLWQLPFGWLPDQPLSPSPVCKCSLTVGFSEAALQNALRILKKISRNALFGLFYPITYYVWIVTVTAGKPVSEAHQQPARGIDHWYCQADEVFIDLWRKAADGEPPETWYTPLVEVNLAIIFLSFSQLTAGSGTIPANIYWWMSLQLSYTLGTSYKHSLGITGLLGSDMWLLVRVRLFSQNKPTAPCIPRRSPIQVLT